MELINPVICIADDFFPRYKQVRDAVLAALFHDVKNDVDGVTYHYVQTRVPQSVVDEFMHGLSLIARHHGINPEPIRSVFARAMPAGVVMPNGIHSDVGMGKYAAHVYLSECASPIAGTLFYRGNKVAVPANNDPLVDPRDPSQWGPYMHVRYRPNRFLMHRADHWHAALPQEGWGGSISEARLVLTCFFGANE